MRNEGSAATSLQTHIDALVVRLNQPGSVELRAARIGRCRELAVKHGHDWQIIIRAARQRYLGPVGRKVKEVAA